MNNTNVLPQMDLLELIMDKSYTCMFHLDPTSLKKNSTVHRPKQKKQMKAVTKTF